MKRLKIITVAMLVALLCLAATAFAGEVSFYDSVNDWIVRVYTADGAAGLSVFMEILDNEGEPMQPSDVLVNGQTPSALPILICGCGLAKPDISVAHKFVGSETEVYVFDTHSDGIQLHNNIRLSINSQGPVPTPANISVSPTSVAFGNVNVGSSSTSYATTVRNTGEATLMLTSINVTGTSFSRNGGTCSTSLAGGSSCTIGVRFQPAAATSYAGNLAIQSSDADTPTVNVALSGTGVVQSGTPDLTLPSVSGLGSSYSVGSTINFSVTVRNSGNGPSGPFKVKVYQSGGSAIGTWSIDNLDAGASLSNTVPSSPNSSCAIHTYCTFTVKADGDNQVAESSESNNTWSRQSLRAR